MPFHLCDVEPLFPESRVIFFSNSFRRKDAGELFLVLRLLFFFVFKEIPWVKIFLTACVLSSSLGKVWCLRLTTFSGTRAPYQSHHVIYNGDFVVERGHMRIQSQQKGGTGPPPPSLSHRKMCLGGPTNPLFLPSPKVQMWMQTYQRRNIQAACDLVSLSACWMFIGLFENSSCLAPENFGASGSYRPSYQREEATSIVGSWAWGRHLWGHGQWRRS